MEYKSISLHVQYGDCGPDGHMRPLSVLRIIQEAGLRHAYDMGMNIDEPHAAGGLLLTTRMHIAFYHPLPRWRESVAIKTWVTEMKRVRAYRAYEMRAGDGRVAARALLDGVLVDAVSHKPVRFEIGNHIPVAGKADTIAPPRKIKPAGDMVFMGERYAEWYQTDLNGHVNNIRHAELALSALPEGYAGRPVRDWTINYLGELIPGQRVRLFSHAEEAGTVLTGGRGEDDGEIFRSRIEIAPIHD